MPSIQAYVLLEQDRPEATVLRRSTGWQAETLRGRDAMLDLAEIGIRLALQAVYA